MIIILIVPESFFIALRVCTHPAGDVHVVRPNTFGAPHVGAFIRRMHLPPPLREHAKRFSPLRCGRDNYNI